MTARHALFLLLFLLLPAAARADAAVVEVDVDCPFKPATVTGLLINSEKTTEKTNLTARKTGKNKYAVAIPITPEDVRPDTVATALVVSEEGKLAFATVKSVKPEETRSSLWALPECEALSPAAAGDLREKTALLQSLIQVRTTRRDALKLKLEKTLGAPMLARLDKLERSLGYTPETPLSLKLSPEALVTRLSKIQAAVANFENYKNLRQPAAPAAKK